MPAGSHVQIRHAAPRQPERRDAVSRQVRALDMANLPVRSEPEQVIVVHSITADEITCPAVVADPGESAVLHSGSSHAIRHVPQERPPPSD